MDDFGTGYATLPALLPPMSSAASAPASDGSGIQKAAGPCRNRRLLCGSR